MGYNSIAWLPLCAGLTVIGLVLSYLAGRRRGGLSMLRGVAWSLLPIAAYLTGSVEMFWKIGAAIGHYADGFVFSPAKWAGVAVAGVAALLFFATRGRERRRARRLARRAARGEQAGPGTSSPAVTGGATRDLDVAAIGKGTPPEAKTVPNATAPAKTPRRSKAPGAPKGKAADGDDDMRDIEEILRKRGL